MSVKSSNWRMFRQSRSGRQRISNSHLASNPQFVFPRFLFFLRRRRHGVGVAIRGGRRRFGALPQAADYVGNVSVRRSASSAVSA